MQISLKLLLADIEVMIKSIRFQIIFSLAAVMTISAVSIIFIVKNDINISEEKKNEAREEVKRQKDVSIQGWLCFIESILIENFDYLLRSKYRLVEKKKKLIESNVNLINLIKTDDVNHDKNA